MTKSSPDRDREPWRERVIAARLSLRDFWIGAIALTKKAEAPEVIECRKPSERGLFSLAVKGFVPTWAKLDTASRKRNRTKTGLFMGFP
jgi:hypothetical protein